MSTTMNAITNTGPKGNIGNLTTNVSFTVNGSVKTLTVEPRRTLAEVLREDLGLTGTHVGCEHGVCGACTVIVDGATTRSCLTLAVQVDGASIETIESLADGDTLHPIQKAMWDNHGFQCAFCASGFLMTLKGLLDNNPSPTREQLRDELSGNLCRCTGYASILAGAEAAVAAVAEWQMQHLPILLDSANGASNA